jgi:sugar phosphate isomerase/epimerase
VNTNTSRREFLARAAIAPLAVATGFELSMAFAHAAEPIKRAGGYKLKTSLNAYSFNQQLLNPTKGPGAGITLFDLLDFCAEHNFDAVDPTGYYFPGYPEVPPDESINNFKRHAFERGLEISGTGVRNNFGNPDKAARAADLKLVKKWVEAAAKLGAPVLRVFAGAEPEGHKWDDVAKWMADDLRQCAEYGKQYGVLIGVQNHGDMLKTAEQTIKVVDLVNSDWFGVIVDTGYFKTEDPYVDIAKVMPYAVNFQVKESVFGKESPIRIDLPRLVKIVRDAGYRGYLPIETLQLANRPYDPQKLVPEFLAELQTALRQNG